MSKPIIVYTAIIGDVADELVQLPGNLGDVECHAFTDHISGDDLDTTGWIVRPPEFAQDDPRRQARQHKALAHELFPDAEITIWVDGTMTPQTKPSILVDRYLRDHDICTFRHSLRGCVFQEVERCARGRKDDVPTIRRQADYYHDEGYPYHNGLAETMVVMRRNTKDVAEVNRCWWRLIDEYSLRDQLSFDFACWRYGLQYQRFDDSYSKQQDFIFMSHW